MQDLLLLHGALGSASQLEPLQNELKDHFKIHRIGFSGHAGRPMPANEFSIPLFAEEVKTFLKENNISSANFFGYSMGGYVALYLAKNDPALIKKIITLATKFHWDETVAERELKCSIPK